MEKIKVRQELLPGRGGEENGIGLLVTEITWEEGGNHVSRQETLLHGVDGEREKGQWKVLMINSREMVKACPAHARICEEVVKQDQKRREEEEG